MSTEIPPYYNYARPEVVGRVDAAGASILDVGCAAGAMGAALLERGAKEVVGIEREARAARLARTRLTAVYQLDLESLPDLPYPDGHFDVITFADVLEHLAEPQALLRHLRRYLKDGGMVVCSIPNIRHESVLLPLLVEGRFQYAEAGILDRTHLRFFTLTEIQHLMSGAGFSIESGVEAVASPPSAHLGRLAEMVSMLGGDGSRFKEEARSIQYLFRARPAQTLARLGNHSPVTVEGPADPWAGSKPLRVLLAPDFANPADDWLTALEELTSEAAGTSQLTIGVAVENPDDLQRLPPRFGDIAEHGHGDLLLTAAPRDGYGWERLMAGASMYLDTAGRRSLTAIARRVGVEVNERAAEENKGRVDDARALYLEVMKRALLNTIYQDGQLNGGGGFQADQRESGTDWPSQAHTMIGRKRLDNLQQCMETALEEGIAGDFIETGVWRGGATILMRAVLKAHGCGDRRVFVADSFAGLPPPNAKAYPADASDRHHTYPELAVSLEQVKANFDRYGLLDEQVVFLQGWFKDTLPSAPLKQLAVVRLDGDMYESTIDAISVLYPKLSPGGFLIVDDYGAVPACRQAIEDYRQAHGIVAAIEPIDWTGVFWRKG